MNYFVMWERIKDRKISTDELTVLIDKAELNFKFASRIDKIQLL